VGTLTSGSIDGTNGFNIEETPIGKYLPSTGNFTTLNAQTATFDNLTVNNSLDLGGTGTISGLATPLNNNDAVSKSYMENSILTNSESRSSCFVATTADLGGVYDSNYMTNDDYGVLIIDGVEVQIGHRVLVKNQTIKSQNGIFVVTYPGTNSNGENSGTAWSMERAPDANWSDKISAGMHVFIEQGEVNKGKLFVFIQETEPTVPFVLDEHEITFVDYGESVSGDNYTPGDGINVSGSTISVAGTQDRISVTSAGVDIASNYSGQSSISTVGSLTSGAIVSGFSGIDSVPIGNGGPSTGAFTSLQAESLVVTQSEIIAQQGLSANMNKITNVALPTTGTDVATKNYVDDTILAAVPVGTDFKNSCFAATTTELDAVYSDGTLTSNGLVRFSVDGSIVSVGKRVLVKDQSIASQNGIYVIVDTGAYPTPTGTDGEMVGGASWILHRATDADSSSDVSPGMCAFVETGEQNKGKLFVFIPTSPINAFALDDHDITFVDYSEYISGTVYTAGDGINVSGSTISVVGTQNRIVVSASGVDIDGSYSGQSSITTVGTLTSGAISGLSGIDATPIGDTTPSTGRFTNISATSDIDTTGNIVAQNIYSNGEVNASGNLVVDGYANLNGTTRLSSFVFDPLVISTDGVIVTEFSKSFITCAPPASTTINIIIENVPSDGGILWLMNKSTATGARFVIDFGVNMIASPQNDSVNWFRYAVLGPAMSTQVMYNGSKWIFMNSGIMLENTVP
jgi:hypothetical protein